MVKIYQHLNTCKNCLPFPFLLTFLSTRHTMHAAIGNENTTDLATAVAQLEGADDAVCLTCGMAAVSSAFIAAGVLKGNKKILGPYSCYGSTYTLMKTRFADIAECEFVDMGDQEVCQSVLRGGICLVSLVLVVFLFALSHILVFTPVTVMSSWPPSLLSADSSQTSSTWRRPPTPSPLYRYANN